MSQDQKPKGVRVVNGSTTPATAGSADRADRSEAAGAGATAAVIAAKAGRGGVAMLGGLFIAASAFGGAAIALLIRA